jgi:hypothetical protein
MGIGKTSPRLARVLDALEEEKISMQLKMKTVKHLMVYLIQERYAEMG